MDLGSCVAVINDFSGWSHADKIRFFIWYMHTYRSAAAVTSAQVSACYDELNLSPPSAISPFFTAMTAQKPPTLLKRSGGVLLENRVRAQFDAKYGQRAASIQVHNLLAELPVKVPDLAERAYLEEALICFKHQAFRAAIVMTWNLAFDHLCHFILSKHLPAFNTQLPKTYPKAAISVVCKRDDFSDLKESQVLQVCASATIVSGSLHKILKEKLDRRNIAAHPSGVVVAAPTAEEFIKDLVENVVLKLR